MNEVVKELTESSSPQCPFKGWDIESIRSSFVLQGDQKPMQEQNSEMAGETQVETQSIVQFVDSTPGEIHIAADSQNTVATVDSTADLSLGTFLARPTTIHTFNWLKADPIGVLATIQPWQLFLSNTAIKKKIDNYGFLRGKLHIKILINATPFQFGLMRAAYTPVDGLVTNKVAGTAAIQLIPYSQQPGIYIEPAENAGGELELPFVYHKNWLDITSNTDVGAFGTLRFVVYAPLDVAITGGSSSLTVRVLAWMTDVELMASTAKLTLQGDDEYGTGAISAPATAIASAASYLTNIPVIGRFARATQIGASAVSKIASLFGFTNVPNIENVNALYPMTAPQLATAEISVPYQKLALDPKTELSIDPTPFGVKGEDQLALSFIKKQESFFGSTVWTTTNVPDDRLMTLRVTPDLKGFDAIVNTVPTNVGFRVNHTPLSYTANMFDAWRGSLKFRFKVVCTKYHKGRLKFSFDPIENISSVNPVTNECYTHILDLGESDELTVTVPYHQALAWLQTDSRSDSSNWVTSAVLAPRPEIDNGQMVIRVFNALEAPLSPSTISILAYVSGGDDFELANPSGSISSTGVGKLPSLFRLQGEEGISDLEVLSSQFSLQGKATIVTFGDDVRPSPDRYGLNYGESIHSLRKLLHRSVVMDTVPLPTGAASSYNIYRKGLCRMPYCPGYTPVAFPTQATKKVAASGNAPYAFNTMHPLVWVAGMFVGYRGSTNFCLTTNSPQITPDDIRFTRATDSAAITATNRVIVLQTSILGSASLSVKCAGLDVINYTRNGLAGYALTSSSSSPSGIFNFPDYNNCNFAYCNPEAYIEGAVVDHTDEQAVVATVTSANATATDEIGYTTLMTSVGAGPDFTCIFFLCCPTVDYLIGDPTPV